MCVPLTGARLKRITQGIGQVNVREKRPQFAKWGGRGSRAGFSCDEQRGRVSEIGIFNLYSDMSHLGPWHLRKAYSLQLSETLICISLPWLLLEMSSF